MKTFKIDIHSKLKNIEITVKNGAAFSRDIIKGCYSTHNFTTNECDGKRIKQFAVKYGNDNSSNQGNWYAHCNGYAMGLLVIGRGNAFSINTYRHYGADSK